ncbi:MAG: SOS response-associated peptidase [Bacteroidales bacterium]|nr:SOS response-associated peptidase [Bacteroidales bacterium]MCF8333487.1 SOS response-associated peptidase [Bacteroidales bacterium]
MCGRFSLTKEERAINARFETSGSEAPYVPRYNAAPGQEQAVITNQKPNTLSFFKWGLVPFWAKDPSIGNKMINAKAETVDQKASFKNPLKRKRCLVISDGFFEWKKTPEGKIPHYIFLKNHELFAFAGLWESWKSIEGEKLNTFTIITTEPNSMMKKIHNRMPVILPFNAEKEWLNNENPKEIKELLQPFDSNKMEYYPISTLVNSPRNDTPEVIQPAGGETGTLF